jgi:flagellar protein FlgJ
MLRAAAKAQAAASVQTESRASHVPAVGRPLGAAANSTGHDAEHAKKAASIDRTSKLYEQCRELESFVIKNLLAGMRKTVEKSGLMDGGFAGEMYEDMLYDEYATTLSKTAGFGLADQAYMELSGRRGRA